MKQVLVADDDGVGRRLVSRILESAGWQVILASDGRQALDLARRPKAPRLLVLDWMMPGMDGPDVIRELRRTQGAEYSYTILLTSRKLSKDLVQGFDAGADDYIGKPCEPQELVARVRVGERIISLQDRLREANERLRIQASVDSLTLLATRREIMDTLEGHCKQASGGSETLSVLLLDLDHFKQVNDTYGHSFGDAVLRATGARISSQLRRGDSAGRLGGEEFLVVLPRCPGPAALDIAERLRSVIAQHPVSAEGFRHELTCSVGAATLDFEAPADAVGEELVRRADVALYAAKRTGRNKVIAAWQLLSQDTVTPGSS